MWIKNKNFKECNVKQKFKQLHEELPTLLVRIQGEAKLEQLSRTQNSLEKCTLLWLRMQSQGSSISWGKHWLK